MKKRTKILMGIFTFLILISKQIVMANNVAATDWENLARVEDVNLDKAWSINLNRAFTDDEIDSISILKENNFIAVDIMMEAEDKRIIVTPVESYEAEEEYSLRIFLSNGKKYKMDFKTLTHNLDLDKSVENRILEIKDKWIKLKPSSDEIKYAEMPQVTSPYQLGKLTEETVNNSLNVTNFIRYLAYLPSDIVINEQFNVDAQAASILNSANDLLTHYPEKPLDMDEELYRLGANGAQKSNIGQGYSSLIHSIKSGYMEDSDSANIDRVGHRLWILSPKLQQIGFGFAPSSSGKYRTYSAMRVIDNEMWKNTEAVYDYISWPSRVAMPGQYFTSKTPWSVSLNPKQYSASNLDDIKVELTRVKDNKTWNFSNASSDGYFNISTSNFGYLPFTLIFRPDEKPDYLSGDKYRVVISDVSTVDGGVEEVSFETTFFELEEN